MEEHDRNVTQTYAGLRWSMLLMVLLLFASVVYQVVATSLDGGACLQPSLSAYYYTPARPVFVAALCAIGALLIVYRGTGDVENVALDVSGFLAFVVAFVPTGLADGACDTSNVPTPDDVMAASANNLVALFLVAAVAVGAAWVASRRGAVRYGGRGRGSFSVTAVLLVVAVVVYLLFQDVFQRYAHAAAAVLLFAGFLVVVVRNSRRVPQPGAADLRVRYRRVSGAMASTAVIGIGGVVTGVEFAVLVLEAALILEFAWFWWIQTVEFADRPVPGEPSALRAEPSGT